LSNCLYGLQRLVYCEEVGLLIQALLPKIEQVKTSLSAIELGNSLYGLQSLGSDGIVLEVLEVLCPKIESCQALDAQAISNSFLGLRKLAGTAVGERGVLSLVPKIKAYRGAVSAKTVSQCFVLLRGVSDPYLPSHILNSLRHLLSQCSERFRSQYILHMIQSLSSVGDIKEVHVLLGRFTYAIEARLNALTGWTITVAFVWLQKLAYSSEVRDMLRVLASCVEECKHFDSSQICTCLEALSSYLKSQDCLVELSRLLEAFATRLYDCQDLLPIAYFRRTMQCLNELGDTQGVRALVSALSTKEQQSQVCEEVEN